MKKLLFILLFVCLSAYGSIEFLNNISNDDTIVLTTARDSKHKDHTIRMLNHYNIRYDRIMFDLRSGPRYLINDIKPPGVAGNTEPLTTAIAVNLKRDEGINLCIFLAKSAIV